MADERTLYAGDLTSDQIGKVIRVKVNPTTTVEDVLGAVKHHRLGQTATKTTLWFRNTQSNFNADPGYSVGHTEHVTVVG